VVATARSGRGSRSPRWRSHGHVARAVRDPLGGLLTLNVGDRVRATASWDSRPSGATGSGPSPVTADFDLFLCSNTKTKCFYSRSFTDNNEGFDITIPAGLNATDWLLFVGWNPSSPLCGSASSELVTWSAITGPPGIF
jgi:hypothetical protein